MCVLWSLTGDVYVCGFCSKNARSALVCDEVLENTREKKLGDEGTGKITSAEVRWAATMMLLAAVRRRSSRQLRCV